MHAVRCSAVVQLLGLTGPSEPLAAPAVHPFAPTATLFNLNGRWLVSRYSAQLPSWTLQHPIEQLDAHLHSLESGRSGLTWNWQTQPNLLRQLKTAQPWCIFTHTYKCQMDITVTKEAQTKTEALSLSDLELQAPLTSQSTGYYWTRNQPLSWS